MKTRLTTAALLSALLVLAPFQALDAQETSYGLSGAGTFGYGALAGLGTYLAYTGPSGEGWLVSDESALFLGIGLGFVTAFAARGLARDSSPSESRRPRMVMTSGIGSAGIDSGAARDFQLGLRWPTGPRHHMETTLLIVSRNNQTTSRQTRCGGFFGCTTGNYVTASAAEQAIALITRARFAVGDGPAPGTVSIGVGPALVHGFINHFGEIEARGLMLEVEGQATTTGHRQWTLGAGLRLTPLGNVSGIDVDDPSVYVRLGLAVGG